MVQESKELQHGHPKFYKLLEEIGKHHSERNAYYATDANPLSNFIEGAKLLNITPAAYALALSTKQYLGVIENLRRGTLTAKRNREHLLDIAVYSLLTIILLEEKAE